MSIIDLDLCKRRANDLHTGGDEYMYLYHDAEIGRGKRIPAYTVGRITRSGDLGQVTSIDFAGGPVPMVMFTEKCFAVIMTRMVPVERAATVLTKIIRNLRQQILSIRMIRECTGLTSESAAWIVAMVDAGLMTAVDVEVLIERLNNCSEKSTPVQDIMDEVSRMMRIKRNALSDRLPDLYGERVKSIDEQCDEARISELLEQLP